MDTSTILMENLMLPSDVEGPYEITIHGEITNATNEVVVIKQCGRSIFADAYVCHVDYNERGEAIISDMPGYSTIRVRQMSTKKIENITYTMVCTAEKKSERIFNNWLY